MKARAWFYLAKVWYARGYYERTVESLNRIEGVLPPLMLLWANLHGGFAIGFLLLGGTVAGQAVSRLFGPARPGVLGGHGLGAVLVLPPLAAVVVAGLGAVGSLAEPEVLRSLATSLLVAVPAGLLSLVLALAFAGLMRHLRLVAGWEGAATLVGLVAKNGILIVDFANKLQERGHEKVLAVKEAAMTRLRPVLMTSVATVVGHFPLTLVDGPGAAARNSIGLVLVGGMTIGTIFTLFVVPSLYVLIAKKHVAAPAAEADEGGVAGEPVTV